MSEFLIRLRSASICSAPIAQVTIRLVGGIGGLHEEEAGLEADRHQLLLCISLTASHSSTLSSPNYVDELELLVEALDLLQRAQHTAFVMLGAVVLRV